MMEIICKKKTYGRILCIIKYMYKTIFYTGYIYLFARSTSRNVIQFTHE